ncbi:MAG: ABC transporter ATP-binding protein/permease [Clostridia bacterium]|nr:ABC transporter ATP-binding protein/permease [Clostridia bacterium]
MNEDLSIMKSSKGKPFRRLLLYGKPYIPWFLLALLIVMVTVALELWQPQILGDAVDRFLEKYKDANTTGVPLDTLKAMRAEDIAGVLRLGGLYLLTVVSIMALTYLQTMLLATVSQKIIYNIRTDIFRHLTKLHVGFFNDNPVGRLVTRVTNDCETVSELFMNVIVNMLQGFLVLFGVIGMMLYDNAHLATRIFVIIPIIVVSTLAFTTATRRIYRKVRAQISELNGFVSERVMGMEVVQSFCAEDQVTGDFRSRTERLRKMHMKQITAHALYSPVPYLTNLIALGIIVCVGGDMVLAGLTTVGTLVVFQRYLTKFIQPVQQLSEEFDTIQSANACAERIFWLLDTEPQITDAVDAIHKESFRGEIEFRHVWFAYKGEEWVLKDVSFKVEPGQRVAFVGATGAGKTTIQNLICRYYDIQKGEILIDGIDIRKIKLDDLRGNIGEMLQDVFLFSGTVAENIRLNEKEITDEEIRQAAITVNADPFISHLSGGYNHQVIERGAAFSAGQRQLLSFARTLAFKPSVLILDEATANIDTDTEILIQDALGKLMEGRTTLIVAHRLSTIRGVDNIIVLHKGEIVEQGNHQELLAKEGTYYKLYKLQYEHAA